MGLLVFHYYLVYSSVFVYSELNFFCITVSIWSTFLNHGVFLTRSQFSCDDVRFCCGCPLINDFTILVLDDDMCARKFFSGCNISLA